VALTFDDGPGPYTETTVATLRRYGMRATFFLCGTSIRRFPDVPRKERSVAALGDHTWSHPDLATLPAAAVRGQIGDAKALVERSSGTRDLLFRPPYGSRSATVDAAAARQGMAQVLWSIDSGDSAGVGWRTMLTRIKADLRPGDIVLFHENRGQTQKVVNRLLPWMRRHGFRSVTVPELLVRDPPTVAGLRREAGTRGALRGGS